MSDKEDAGEAKECRGRARGGAARAQALSPERRKEIGQQGAAARWKNSSGEIPEVVHSGDLVIGGLSFHAYVLSDGTRVFAQSDFMESIGSYYSGYNSENRTEGGLEADLPQFLSQKCLEKYVKRHFGDSVTSVTGPFRTDRGHIIRGIRAEFIPNICDVWLDAEEDGVLSGPTQKKIAHYAKILMRGLARVGIIALVDEATGYQECRERDALAKILEEFIDKELRPWVKTFPPEFYKELCRLRKIAFSESGKHPKYFGSLTNDIVYDRLAPGVKAELKKKTPRAPTGRHKHQLHRWLTADVGAPKLQQHIASVVTIMKLSDTNDDFKANLDRIHPVFPQESPAQASAGPTACDPDGMPAAIECEVLAATQELS